MKNMNLKEATFGGGCFWCVESLFQSIKGVENVFSGYAGGKTSNPTYRDVSNGKTGHAEVVRITYDENIVKYEDLLVIFLNSHDPTTLNRQGADYGTQYRSIILYHDDVQKAIAERVLNELNPLFNNSIVTELKQLDTFYKAEDYHQNYYIKNPHTGYCLAVIDPKLKKLKMMYPKKIKENN